MRGSGLRGGVREEREEGGKGGRRKGRKVLYYWPVAMNIAAGFLCGKV
jgi:hypothetical protein